MKNMRLAFLILIVLLSGCQYLLGRENATILKDTLITQLPPVDLSDISLKSSELKLRINQEIRDLISDNAVRRIKSENYSLIYAIDPDLFVSIDPDNVSISIRDLENKQVKYLQIKRKIEQQKI
jgi:hypothetical protein